MPEKLQIIIDAKDQASGVIKGLAGNAKSEFAGMASTIKAHAGEIRAAGMAMTAVGAGTLAVAKGNLDAYRQQEEAQQKLTAAIKGSSQAIDQSHLEKLASDLQAVTTFGDEATIQMMAMLTTFNMTQDQIEQLAPRIQNIAAMMGTDLQSAAVAVGKAIQMESAGALNRYGIIIDEATMKSGDFNAILKAIDANTGPAAEELAKGAGAAQQLANQFGDLREVAGEALVPALKMAVDVLKPMVGLAQDLVKTPIGKAFVLAGTGAGLAAAAIGPLLVLLPSVAKGWEILTGAQIRNAAAARAAGAANAQAGAAAAAGGAAAAAGGAAAGGGGLLRGLGAGAAMRGAGGLALRYALPAYLAYEGAKYAFGRQQAGAEAQIEAIESGEAYTAEEKKLMASNKARWDRKKRLAGTAGLGGGFAAGGAGESPDLWWMWQRGELSPAEYTELSNRQQAGNLSDEDFAAFMKKKAEQEQQATVVPAVSADLVAPPRSLAGVTEIGPGAFSLPTGRPSAYARALRGRGQARRSLGFSGEDLSVREESLPGGGRKVVVEVLVPAIGPGAIQDVTTDWLDDFQYQREGPF